MLRSVHGRKLLLWGGSTRSGGDAREGVRSSTASVGSAPRPYVIDCERQPSSSPRARQRRPLLTCGSSPNASPWSTASSTRRAVSSAGWWISSPALLQRTTRARRRKTTHRRRSPGMRPSRCRCRAAVREGTRSKALRPVMGPAHVATPSLFDGVGRGRGRGGGSIMGPARGPARPRFAAPGPCLAKWWGVRKGRSEAKDVRSTLTRRPSRSYAPRPPDKLQCVPGAAPGLVGLPPLPVTRLPLRVRQRHDHSTPLRNGPVTGGSAPGRSRHRAAMGSTAAALQRAGSPEQPPRRPKAGVARHRSVLAMMRSRGHDDAPERVSDATGFGAGILRTAAGNPCATNALQGLAKWWGARRAGAERRNRACAD